MKINLSIMCTVVTMLFITSCDRKDPTIPNEEELITTLNFTLTPEGGGTSVVLSFKDLDGDGGNNPVITSGTLDTNTTYAGLIQLLNELEDPTEDISEEVEEEAKEHQFFFQTTVDGLTITYGDKDADGKPIGLVTTVTTAAAGSGTIKVVLKHEPDKSAAGVSSGEITNAGGETDLEVTFTVDVQ